MSNVIVEITDPETVVETEVINVIVELTGEPGPAGAQGDPGQDGVGVPAGGTAGQVLAKIDGTDYNTEWVDQTGGGGGSGTVTSVSVTTANGVSGSLKSASGVVPE